MRTRLLLLLLLPLSACGGERTTSAGGGATAGPSTSASRSPSPGTASATPAASPSASTPGSVPSPTPGGTAALIGDGIDLPSQVVAFDTPYEQARAPFDEALGTPSLDTGVIDPFSGYGTCPGADLQVLEYGGGALQLYFGALESEGRTFYSWALADRGTPADVPRARALVGDQATYDFGVGTPVGALQEGLGQILTVDHGDEVFGPGFQVADQSGGFSGSLDSTAPDGEVTFVVAGQGCGEQLRQLEQLGPVPGA